VPTFTRAGELNRRIYLQAAVDTQDATTGEMVTNWEQIGPGPVWAAAEPGRGREFYAAAGIVAESPMLFRTHHRFDVSAKMRVLYRGDVYSVDSVQDYRDARTETWIYARAGVNAG